MQVLIDGVVYVPKQIDLRSECDTLPSLLVKARRKMNITMDRAADLAGLTKSNVCQAEQGRDHPSMRTVVLLAELYGIPFADIATAFKNTKYTRLYGRGNKKERAK